MQYDGPLEVVLVEVGDSPERVAEVLKATLNLTLTEPTALAEALPLVLFQQLPRAEAEAMKARLHGVGAAVELRVPRRRTEGLGKGEGPDFPGF